MLGRAFWVLVAFWVTVFAYVATYSRRSLPRLRCHLVVILVAYAIPSHAVVKEPFFGGGFYGVLIVSSVAVAADMWRQLVQSGARPVLLSSAGELIAAAGIALLIVTNIPHPFVPRPRTFRSGLMGFTTRERWMNSSSN